MLVLAGCSTTVPVKQKFPEVPQILLEKCPPLDKIGKPSVSLSELTTTITKNYTKYHLCADAVENWQEWYTQQKKIFEDLNK